MGEAFSHGAFRQGLRGIFPPFYPLVVGLFHLVVPDLELAGRIASLAAGLLVVLLSFYLFKELIGETKALCGAFFVAVNPYLVKYSTAVLSESVAILLVLVTVLLFYDGWTGGDVRKTALSGFTLSLTYLTRPEYVVYMLPLAFLLVIRRKIVATVLFLVPFAVLVAAYMYVMKLETGLFLLSKKAIAAKDLGLQGATYHSYFLPMVSLVRIVRHIPTVLYDFFNALLPQFAILALMGMARIAKPYKVLLVLLVSLHLLVVAVVNASSKRFYVELIPLIFPLSVAGIFVLRGYLQRLRSGKVIFSCIIAALVAFSVFQGIELPSRARGINKEAGLYLLRHDPHQVIASGLPLVPFYSKGQWSNIYDLAGGAATCPALGERLKAASVTYVVVDEDAEKAIPLLAKCLETGPPVARFGDGSESVRLYRLTNR